MASGKENVPSPYSAPKIPPDDDDDDDFLLLKKKPRVKDAEDLKALFQHSSPTNCTFNIQISK